MRILYVEDNQANVFLVKRVAKGHSIINYIDGEEALRNFEDDNPDIVLMDIQLAGRLGGLDVIKQLRAEGYTIPIIAVTAYAMVGDRERCLEAGCNEYLAKPLPIPQLIKLFQQYEQEIQKKALQSKPEKVAKPEVETIIPIKVNDTLSVAVQTTTEEATSTTADPVSKKSPKLDNDEVDGDQDTAQQDAKA